MKKILFVCHGNICRSPMAESIFMHLAAQRGLQNAVHAESAATSYEEIGNGVYPQAQAELRRHDVPVVPHQARRLTREDYAQFDLIIGMDHMNMSNILRIVGSDPDDKFRMLMQYTDHPRDVADPWINDRFDIAYRDILEGCEGLLRELTRERK